MCRSDAGSGAAPGAGVSSNTESNAFLTFDLGPKRLAMALEDVVEVTAAVAISAVPTGPPMLEGVVNYRGRIVAVLDARAKLRLAPRALAVDEHMIFAVVGPGTRVAALRVDRALDVISVPDDALEDARARAPEAERTAGLIRLADGVLAICDLERFLSPSEALAVDVAVSASASDLARRSPKAGKVAE